MSVPLRHVSLQTQVTALAHANRYILAAEGPFIRLYQRDGSGCRFGEKVFESQTIHGIVVVDATHSEYTSAIAYAGRHIRPFCLLHDESRQKFALKPGAAAQLLDRVLDLARPLDENHRKPLPLASGDDSRARTSVAITAHNQLARLCWPCSSPTSSIFNVPNMTVTTLSVRSRSTLYSAHIIWLSESKVLVAAGTAFGEILVWSCNFSGLARPQSCVHHIFTGHEGSVLGVQISPRFSSTGDEDISYQLLASCSDDRTMRIWDISRLPDVGHLRGSDDALGLIHSTIDQVKCLAVSWGHASRVWAVRFAGFHAEEHSSHLVSIGEDATCCTWDLQCKLSRGSELVGLKVSPSILDTRTYHSGKNIWAVDVDASPHSSAFEVFTGAADSSIAGYCWPLRSVEMLSSHPKTDAHRCCSFYSGQAVVSATNSGTVLISRGHHIRSLVWQVVCQLDDLKGYSISNGLPKCGLAFLASSSGRIYAYDERTRKCSMLATVSRKVSRLFASCVSYSAGTETIRLLVTSVNSSAAEDLEIIRSAGCLGLHLVGRVVLNLPPSFIVTSATHTTLSGEATVFLGAGNGLVAQFPAHCSSKGPTPDSISPAAVFELHTPESVTSLTWIERKATAAISNYLGHLVSTGRDGYYVMTEVHIDSPAVIVHQVKLPFGPRVEGCSVRGESLILYGFRGKHFVAVNAATEQEITSINCGGARRIWSFALSDTGEGGAYVWNQASSLKLFCTDGMAHRIIKAGAHGREIQAAAACPSDARVLATGAEDTAIRIHHYGMHDSPHSHFKCVRVLRKHVAGIRHLAWSDDGNLLFSSGGYEEFFVWRIRRLPLIGLGVVCEAVCPPEGEQPELRIMDFAILNNTKATDESDVVIALVCSDSTLRTYSYASTPTTKTFTILQVGKYLTCCLTQIAHLTPSLLLTAGTDGFIAFWSLLPASGSVSSPCTLSYDYHTPVHQSTIRSFALARLSANAALLLTAGDDNALAITLLRFSDTTPSAAKPSTLLIPKSHAAAVTAVVFVDNSDAADWYGSEGTERGETRFVALTASNDQRVKVWEIVVERSCVDQKAKGVEAVRVRKLADMGNAVAEVADMIVLPAKHGQEEVRTLVLVGVGMEAFEVTVR